MVKKNLKAWTPAATVKTGLVMLLGVMLAASCSSSNSGNPDDALALIEIDGKYGFIDRAEKKQFPANMNRW